MEPEIAVDAGRLVDLLPAVAAPAHDRGKRQRDGQPRAGPHRADRGVRPPERVRRDRPPGAIALPHRARPVERAVDLPRHQQLDELGMRPGQRHRRSARPPRKQPAFGYRLGVPHLLRDHPAGARHGRHCREIGQRVVAGFDLVMAALAGQERPAASDAGAVEGAAVRMLAIAVAEIAVPHRPRRRVGAQQRIGELERSEDQRVVGAAQPEAHELQEFGADLLVAAQPAVAAPVADRHDRGAGAGLGHDAGRRDADVIARNIVLPGQLGAADRRPGFDLLVPEIGERQRPVAFRFRQQLPPRRPARRCTRQA